MRAQIEIKIFGVDFFLVSAALAAAMVVLAAVAGDLLDFYPVCFEVTFPFFAAVAVGEWGKTRADGNFDVIAAQSRSLFQWAFLRYAAAFAAVSAFALFTMAGASLLRREMPIREALLLYFPPAFFLSSLCTLLGLYCRQEHVAPLACGLLWLTALLTRSLLRFPGVEYLYLFIRFAGDQNGIWLWNKGALTLAGLFLWCLLYGKCRRMP